MSAAVPSPHIHVPFQRISEYSQLIRERKLDLEIYFSADCLDSMSAWDISDVRDILSYRPALSFHAPFMDLSPSAFDLLVRQVTIDRFTQTFSLAEILRPKCIVFHSGYEKWKYSLRIDTWLEQSIEFWEPFIDRAKKIGTKIAIENIFEDEPTNLRMLMERIGSEHFGICFDTGHFNLFSKVPLQTWLDELGSHFVELHVHDNDTTADQHLPIGDGVFDFRAFFRAIQGKDLVHTIETHTPERVIRSMERFAQFMQDASRDSSAQSPAD
jgi:sugar phosphate isomerase/epimerase